jgi:hypothetical protein
VDPAIKGNTMIYPSEDVMGKLYALEAMPAKIDRIRTRIWTSIKAGTESPATLRQGVYPGIASEIEPSRASPSTQVRAGLQYQWCSRVARNFTSGQRSSISAG